MGISTGLVTAQDLHNLLVRCEPATDIQLILAALLSLVREYCYDVDTTWAFACGISSRVEIELLAVQGIAAVDLDGVISKVVQCRGERVERSRGVIIGGPDGFSVVRRVVAYGRLEEIDSGKGWEFGIPDRCCSWPW
jgi:hypothetical protein